MTFSREIHLEQTMAVNTSTTTEMEVLLIHNETNATEVNREPIKLSSSALITVTSLLIYFSLTSLAFFSLTSLATPERTVKVTIHTRIKIALFSTFLIFSDVLNLMLYMQFFGCFINFHLSSVGLGCHLGMVVLLVINYASCFVFILMLNMVTSSPDLPLSYIIVTSCKLFGIWIYLKNILLSLPTLIFIKMRMHQWLFLRLEKRTTLKLKHCYVSKIFVKFWDPSNELNNYCPTCQAEFEHPADAITNVNLSDQNQPVYKIETDRTKSKTVTPDDLDTVVTCCGHCFHYSCLRLSLDRNDLCPICRQQVLAKELFIVCRRPPAPVHKLSVFSVNINQQTDTTLV